MPALAILLSPGVDHALVELVEAIRAELGNQAVQTVLGDPTPDIPFDCVWCVVLGAGGEVPLTTALEPGRTIAIVADLPLGSPERSLAHSAAVVFAFEQRVVDALGALGIASRLLRPGWSPRLDHGISDAERTVDVVVLDAEGSRAARWMDRARRMRPGYRWEGADRNSGFAACSHARVAVALHAGSEPALGWRAPLQASLGGAVLVGETAFDLSPFVPGEHLLLAAEPALIHVVDVMLREPERLARLRDDAHERIRTWLPLAPAAARLRAAVVETLAQPRSPVTPG